MARPGITHQEVANAAIQLQGQNENPTVDRIREILGTGSKSTIARYLKDWKSKTGHISGSDGIPHELISIIKGLWERLKSESDKQITQHQQEANLIINEVKQSLSQEQQQNRSQQAQVCQLEDQLHQEKHKSQTLLQSLEEEKRSNAKLSERNDRLSEQLLYQKTETDRLHQLLSHVQNNLEHYQLSVQKLREEQALLLEKEKSEYNREINYLKNENIELQRNLDQFKQENKSINDQKNTLVDENSNFKKLIDKKTINESILNLKCEQLEKSEINYQKKIEVISQKLIEYEKQLAVLTSQSNSLQNLLNEAQDKIHVLRDEKLFLTQEKSHLEGQLKQLESTIE